MRPAWFDRRFQKKKSSGRRFHTKSISRDALEAFLDRPREDWKWVKSIPDWKLKLYVYGKWNQFHTRPRIAQFAGFAIGIEEPNFLYNYGCGVGKTKLLLDLIRWHREFSGTERWLVLVPNIINFQTWADQIELHQPELTYEMLLGDREVRHELVNQRRDIHILNYAGLMSYMTEPAVKGGRELNRKAGQSFADMYDGVVYDEIHEVSNKDSKRYWMCRRLSRTCKYRYGGSATLFNDPEQLWSEFDLIDHGYTFGESLGLFRGAFFREVETHWSVEYEFDKSKQFELSRLLRNRSLRYTAKECGDMPKVNRIPERLRWGDEQLAFYRRIISDCKVAGVGKVRLNPNTYIRMRQICSGYVGYSTEDDGKAKLEFDQNPKLERLLQVMQEMPRDTKIMIFCQYIYTGQMIYDALHKHKLDVAQLFGEMKDPLKHYNRFLHDKACRGIVAQYKRVSGGNPHEVASFMYFFESPPDPVTRTQVEERENRPGQPNPVFIYNPMMPNSVDEDILSSLAEGRDFHDAVADGEATTSALSDD